MSKKDAPKKTRDGPRVPPIDPAKPLDKRAKRVLEMLERDEKPKPRTANTANLRPWKPGQSGNPSGVPPGYVPYATAYRIAATLPDDELEILRTGQYPPAWSRERCQTYCIAAAAVLKMRSDTPPALMSEVADRSDGKVPQQIRASVDVQGIICLPAGPQGLAWGNVVDTHLIDAPARAALPESASDSSDES